MSELEQIEFELIEAYLQDRMSAEERPAFEARLANEDDLRKEVSVQNENMLAVELGAFSETMKELADHHSKENPAVEPDPAVSRGTGRWIGMAAGVAALLALTLWLTNGPDLSEEIMAEYYEVDPGLPVTMGAADNYQFNDAMVDYKAGEYLQAIGKWQAMEAAESNDTIRYYIASACLARGEPRPAIPLFKLLAAETSSVFSQKAQWYLLLAYVEAGKIEKAKAVIIAPDSPCFDQAVKVKQKLN